MPFASPRRSRSRSRSRPHSITHPGGSPPPLLRKSYPKSESIATISSSIVKKPSIRYCCLLDLFRTQKRFKKKKKVVVVVVGAVHRRRLSPTLVVRERRRRGTSNPATGKSKSGRRAISYTGSGTGTGAGISTGGGGRRGGAGEGARPGNIRKRTSNNTTTTSLRASGVTSVYNPTAPLSPIAQKGEGTDSSSDQAEVEEVEDTQASCPPAARHPLIIFVRAYKKRRRNQAGAEKQDEEAAMAAAAVDDGNSKNRRSGRSSGGGGGGGFRDADAISPVPRAARSHQEVRDIVEQGFHRSRRSGGSEDIGVERGVVFGQGYSVWNGGGPGQQQQPQQESAAPVIGKIERIMGNPLSNDFYSDRASGSGHSRTNSAVKAAKEKKRESKRHSYPVINTRNVPLRTSSARPPTATLEPDTNLSPISPDETELSTARDFSPYGGNGIFKALSPPPAAPAAVALRYPNVTALVRANISGEPSSKRSSYRSSYRASNRSSYTQLHDGASLSDHISSQYSRIKEQKSPSPTHIEKVITPDPLPSPPAWAAFGGFSTSRNSKSSSSQPSRISVVSSGTEKSAEASSVKSPGHAHRISWNGRSVLDLDPAPPPVPSKRSPPPPPLSAPSISAVSHPLRRKDKNIPIEPASPPNSPPKFATAPRIRTSAFGPYRQKNYPQLPPIPPGPEDIASGPGQLFLPTMMTRSGSNSKMSVLSVPSTISSFNTINTVTRSTGLSPTPARHTPRNTPEPFVVDESRDNSNDNRMSVGTSTILTETSETSNMTAAELELEMRKIRERAMRASENRRINRKRHDESWLAEEEAEKPVVGPSGVGHRFF